MTTSETTIAAKQNVPRATYRLQFNRDFTLRRAAELVPYLHELGISHVYASPLLKACAGSLHGYDVCDCSQLNPEIGTEAELESFVEKLRAHGMGLVLDIVPNHMAAGAENPWWWDVLKHGRQSRYADHFDIDWNSPDPKLNGKIIVPVLGDEYDRVLEQNQFTVRMENGEPVLCYFDHRFPLAPESIPTASKKLTELNNHPRELDSLLQKQHYRLAFWRHGDKQLNYRRFFNITTLAGVRVEDPKVFRDTHVRILDWYQRGWLDGLRIDHPDGLRDPQAYLFQLRQAAPNAWIVVEKILEPGESLPADWPVAGTTGYDFLNWNGGLFVDPSAEKRLTSFYTEFTGEPADYAAMVCTKKRWVLEQLLRTEMNRLVRLLEDIVTRKSPPERQLATGVAHSESPKPAASRRSIPLSIPPGCKAATPNEWRDALIALVVCLPVYRTYIRAGQHGPSAQDRQWLQEAKAQALQLDVQPAHALLDFLTGILQSTPAGDRETEFIMRFQQLTGPAMAKGVEDTSFYCFNRFVMLNEVGGDPGHFGISAELFHKSCLATANRWPDTMLSSSTHDTKRSEDVRDRLALLSEIPDEWTAAVRQWSAHNEPHRRDGFPDRNAEYLFYQSLVGAWPLSVERAVAYMKKASCEAKQHTNWTEPNAVYDDALKHFVTAAMDDKTFMADIEIFLTPLIAAGHLNSLAQTLIKLTAPGVPDIYQGTELWDLSLVDPDNRRAVDFELRERLMAEAKNLSAKKAWNRREEGLPKLWMIMRVLALRAEKPDWFRGDYEPLTASGSKANHLVAYRHGEILVIVPRFTLSLRNDWADTTLTLPPGNWRNEFTPEAFTGQVSPGALFQQFPVALLVRSA